MIWSTVGIFSLALISYWIFISCCSKCKTASAWDNDDDDDDNDVWLSYSFNWLDIFRISLISFSTYIDASYMDILMYTQYSFLIY